ncbi:MAG: glutathione S-transferase family protein [Pseudomonadales bacterium]|jgi:glutathione S-transferase|tara:strand:- start:2476 stop:3096 length:621 start_codon:yes stop_codon:yes gene_type:complete
MKLYSHATAPNPRRVNVFIIEKNLEIETVKVDMQAGEHKAPEFLAKNLNGQIPVLELDDGSHLSESVSICRYLEALNPEPALFGTTPAEMGRIDMHMRRIELMLGRNVSTSWVNGPVVARIAKGRFKQIPEAKLQSDDNVRAYYKRLDAELAARRMIAGDTYTMADITAMCVIDFAEQLVALSPDDQLLNLARWRNEVGKRPSAKA